MPLLTEKYISNRLTERLKNVDEEPEFPAIFTNSPRPAAVLLPLFHLDEEGEKNNIWQMLLTRRTNTVAEHQGQVAFPGGSADPTDTSLNDRSSGGSRGDWSGSLPGKNPG